MGEKKTVVLSAERNGVRVVIVASERKDGTRTTSVVTQPMRAAQQRRQRPAPIVSRPSNVIPFPRR